MSTNTPFNYSLDLDGSGGIDVNGGGFTTSEKYGTLSTTRNAAGGTFGKDVAHVVSTGGINLNPGQREQIAFAIIAGDSLLDIQASADAAQIRYNNDNLSLVENDKNNDIKIYPNPTAGLIHIYSGEQIEEVIVRNAIGESIHKFSTNEIDVTAYPNGIYFVEVTTGKYKKIKKVVLSK